MTFKLGELVGYKSCQDDEDFQHVGKVREVLLNGIPSHRGPLIMIEGKAGVVLPAHCTRIPTEKP